MNVIVLSALTLFCFILTPLRPCQHNWDYYTRNYYADEDSFEEKPSKKVKNMPSIDILQNYMPQPLVAISCISFVKNSLKTIQTQFASQELPCDHNLLKSLFATALTTLPSEDTERFYKIVTILKKMPLELYGDLAFLINQQKGIQPQDDLTIKEKNELFTVLKYLQDHNDDIRIRTIEFFRNHEQALLKHMMRDATAPSIPHQVMHILLTHGAIPEDSPRADLIPHRVSVQNSKNLLEKIKLILLFKTSEKKNLKERAQNFLSLWNNPKWIEGIDKVEFYPAFYKLEKAATPEEIKTNKMFFTDIVKLIEEYEPEIQDKEDQILLL